MLKSCRGLLTVLLFAGVCCFGESLSDRIPAFADVVIGADVRAILKNPQSTGKLGDLSALLKKAGVPEEYANQPEECFGNALLCIGVNEQNAFVLLETPHVTLDNLAKLWDVGAGPAQIGTCGSFRCIDLQNDAEDPVQLVELKKGLLLVTAKSKLAQNAGGMPQNSALKKLYDSTKKGAVVRGAIITSDLPLSNDPQGNPLPKLQASTMALQLTGKNGDHVIFDSEAIAENEQEAAKAQLGIQQMLLVISVVMGDDPDLAQELLHSVKISRNGLTLSCHADLPPALTKRLVEYAEKKAASEKTGVSQPPAPPSLESGR